MKTWSYLLMTYIILNFSYCKPYSYFSTSNDLLNVSSTVYLTNGTTISGKLTIQLESNTNGRVQVTTSNNQTASIPIDSIKYYEYELNRYYPRKVNLDVYEIPVKDRVYRPEVRNLIFLKQLTSDTSKIGYYELYEPRNKSQDGTAHYYYYVSLPGDDRLTVWATGSSRFFPRFDEKMSAIVSDCTWLSEKIRNKENGYNLGQLSLEVKKQVVFRQIIEAYNKCVTR